MLLHFDDATSLTGARLWKRDKLILLYGVHHTLELQCIAGPDNTPIDIESLNCTNWTLDILPSLASPALQLVHCEYPDNIAVGDIISFDFSTATQAMYRYIAGEQQGPGVLELKGYEQGSQAATIAIQIPLILRTTAVNPCPPCITDALMEEIQRAAASTTSAADATSQNASIVDSLASAVEVMSTQTQSNTDYVSSIYDSMIVDSGSMAEMLSSATQAASSAQANADHTDSNVSSSIDLLSSTIWVAEDGISAMEEDIAVASSIYSNTSSVASAGMDITSSNVQSSVQLLSSTVDAMDSTLAASEATASNTASVAQMSTAVRSDMQSTAQMRTDVQGMSSNVVSMSNAVSNMDSEVTSMSTTVSTMSASIYNMESNVEAMSARVTSMHDDTSSDMRLASSYASAAGSYVSDASVWAEGTDAQVQELGGEHSAKVWAQHMGDGRVTITQGGTSKGSFTMNQSSDVTIALDAGGGGGGGGAWGSITGDISSQTDLMDKLDSKADLVDGTVPRGQLPVATTNYAGVVIAGSTKGLTMIGSYLNVKNATNEAIANRDTSNVARWGVIAPDNLNYAVTAALTDSNHITLTTEQQATAQEVLGVPAPIIGNTAPTTATVGKLMQQYLNSTTGKTYHCTAITNTGTEAEPVWEYTWTDDINSKGGTIYGVGTPVGEGGLGIGYNCKGVIGSLAVGYSCTAGGVYSLAVGYCASTTQQSEINLGYSGYDHVSYATTWPASSSQKNVIGMRYHESNLYLKGSYQQHITEIPAATTSYNLAEGVQSHTPAEASNYVFPAVTDTTRTHRIRLILDFTSVQTYAFEDAQCTALAPLFTPTIAAGDVYEFDCEYSAAKSQWLIWPHKQGAVSDDYVMQSEVGAANGVAGLDANGKLGNSQMHAATYTDGSGVLGGLLGAQNIVHGVRIGNGQIEVQGAPNARIDNRSWGAISGANLNYAVTAALTDANKISLTDAQKASAQDTLGAYGTLHLDAAPTTSTVGAFGQRAIVDSTGKAYTCTAVTVDETDPQNPVTTYTWQEDLPKATGNVLGTVTVTTAWGFSLMNNTIYNNAIRAVEPSNNEINLRVNTRVLTLSKLNYAVRSVLPNITEIPAATSAYTLIAQDATTNNHSYTYTHIPESAPTYTLPAVTDNTVQHEIVLDVRFSSTVLTYAFEDSAGNPITPLATPTITDGTVVTFLCRWNTLLNQWTIMPIVEGVYTAPEP